MRRRDDAGRITELHDLVLPARAEAPEGQTAGAFGRGVRQDPASGEDHHACRSRCLSTIGLAVKTSGVGGALQ